jgi:Ca2+/Na+ antiporter
MTLLPLLAIVGGLAALVWSADRFVSGAAGLAYAFGMPPLLIGMLVVGFGTSAPEMLVSAIAAIEGRPGLALGNAYGSNIANIGLILGLTALISRRRSRDQPGPVAPAERGDENRQRREIEQKDRRHRSRHDRREQQGRGCAGAQSDDNDLHHHKLSRLISG